MLIYLIIGVASRQINNVSEHIVQLNHSVQYWQQDIELGIEYDIHNYSHGGAVLQSSLTGDHADLCQVVNENINFNEPHIVQIISEVFDYKDGYITQNEFEDLVGMVHQNQSVVMVGNIDHIYQMEFNTLLPMKYNLSKQVGTFICGIFNPQLQYTYIIYTNYIVYYQDINNIVYQQNNYTNVVDVETSQTYVYIATKDSVQILEILDGGSLLYLGHIELESIVDISIGGVTGQSLYILYHSGVIVYNVFIGDTGLNITLNDNLSLIPIEGGYKMDQVNDESLLILVKVGQSHAAVIDFCIDLLDGYWFVVNKYMVQGEPRDIDMTNEIAILQGIDGHTVIYHSVFSLFQQHKQNDKVIYIPGAISLDFYEPTFGIQNLPSHWHYNQTRNELFGINSNQLFLIPWSTVVPNINCICTDEPQLVSHSIQVQPLRLQIVLRKIQLVMCQVGIWLYVITMML